MNRKIISFIILVIIIILFLFLAYSCTPAQEDKEDLFLFLRASRFIDSDHPGVVKKALKLTNDCNTEDGEIIIETLPVSFADRTEEMIELIEKIDCGQ